MWEVEGEEWLASPAASTRFPPALQQLLIEAVRPKPKEQCAKQRACAVKNPSSTTAARERDHHALLSSCILTVRDLSCNLDPACQFVKRIRSITVLVPPYRA